jgi:predicted methyltransferase
VRALAAVFVALTIGGWALRPAPREGWLGVTVGNRTIARGPAARLDSILEDSPARAAKLESGDLVWALGRRRIGGARDLVRAVRRQPPGSRITLAVLHGHEERVVEITLAPRPADVYRLLEVERDAWQEPERVLDLLGLAPGATVADLGAGSGYFTERLSRRVGPAGRVLAIDVADEALETLTSRFPAARFPQVTVQRGAPADPGLAPGSLDALLMVDTFHEIADPPAVLAIARRALRPAGRVVVVDRPAEAFRPEMHAIPEARVVDQMAAAGFRLRERHDLPRQFLAVFE